MGVIGALSGVRAFERRLRVEPQFRWALWGAAMAPYRRHQFHRFGAGSFVHRPEMIARPWKIAIGAGCLVLHGIWLSAEQETLADDALAISIGDRVSISPHCTISAASRIVIEDAVTIAAQTSLVDSNHTFGAGASVLDHPITAEPIHIGRGSWLGQRVAVLPGAHIGERCAIGANSVVRGEIPDGSVAVGSPAKVVGSTG